VTQGRYTLTELALARRKWRNPHGHVLPVIARKTPFDEIPSYLKAVTILEPRGNITPETCAAVDDLVRGTRAKEVAWRFAAVGAVAGAISSFFPTVMMKSMLGFNIFGSAPDVGFCSTEKPCATRIASVQSSRDAASNSSARRRVAGGLRSRALRRGLPTEDIARAYGTTMSESSRAGRVATGQLSTCRCARRLRASRPMPKGPGAADHPPETAVLPPQPWAAARCWLVIVLLLVLLVGALPAIARAAGLVTLLAFAALGRLLG
jgi:hypothetical protein